MDDKKPKNSRRERKLALIDAHVRDYDGVKGSALILPFLLMIQTGR